ncbi:MAG: NUDIX domain-containing protein [Candidatus Thorarchaeota archaeon]|nr:MAG: NUDIX domain-containing protein [Candidatus Thorarchaeota archaeon]
MSDRKYPTSPILGVGAIVVGPEGVLMGTRDKDPGKGLLSIPGGAVEVGETQEEAAAREVLEETGVTCQVLQFVSTADLISLDSQRRVEYHFVLNHYLCRATTSETTPESPDTEVMWVHPNMIEEMDLPPRIRDLLLGVKEDILSLMK